MKSKGTAAVLALLLGGFGVHKFYLDQAGQGVIYLLFCWTFIPAFIAFFEAIVYVTMSDEAFQRKYGRGQLAYQQHSLPGPQSQNAQNITVNMAGHGQAPGGISDELEKLANLKAAGALTDDEFQAQKRKLLES